MSVNQPGDVAYGFSQALLGIPGKPIIAQRSPTTNDKTQIGTIWINEASNEVFFLTSIVDNVATWVQAVSGAGFITQVDTDSGSALPVAGIINAFGGDNINTTGAGNTVTINLNDNVDLPATNATGTQGIYQIGGQNFLFGYGPTNTFVGGDAGNTGTLTVLSALNNVGLGYHAIQSLTTGANNTALGAESLTTATTGTNNLAVGYLSLTALTSGDSNIAIGNQSLENLVSGDDNIAIGFAAGSALNAAQSSNIYIGSQGNVADTNTIRIGTQGNGAGQQDSCYIAGIVGVTPGGTPEFVVIDPATGELGTASSTGAIDELLGDNGDTASGSTVVVTGGDNITTAGDNIDTLTISVSGTTDHALQLGNAAGSLTSLGVATNGQLPIGSTGADPVLATLTPGTNIGIVNAAGSITINNTAPAGIQQINGNLGGSTTGPTVTFRGAEGTAGWSVGFLVTGTTVDINIGDPDALANCIVGALAGSNSGGVTGGSNTGLGVQALYKLSSGSGNVGVGMGCQLNNADSNDNVSIGQASMTTLNTGDGKNTAVGNASLNSIIDGDNNIAIGYLSGNNYTGGSESSNIVIGSAGVMSENNVIRIGTQGSGTAQQNSCFIAGIGGVTPGGTPEYVIIDPATGELGSTSSGGSGITTLDGDSGSATGATVTIAGGSNITTSAAGSTVTIALDNSVSISGDYTTTGGNIDIPATTASQGIINQAGSNFLHSFGDPSNIFLGSLAGNLTTVSNLANIGIGFQALQALTSGIGNNIMGYQSGFNITSGNSNTIVGNNSCAGITTGSNNTAFGAVCLINSAGQYNTFLGAQCGTAATAGTESSNIYIMNAGVMGESNTMRLGTTGSGNGQVSTAYIAGIAGVTVANSTAVLIDTTTGQLGTIASSRRYKENIEDMDGASARILELHPVKFNYKNDPTREIHYGLIAEEVDGIMPDIVTYNKEDDPETVRYHELPALLLNELQKQHAIIADLSRRLERLERRASYESTT